jgi:hypothetical protein
MSGNWTESDFESGGQGFESLPAHRGERRRNAALREIERHRAIFSQALRRASDEVVDAQFEHVEAPQIEDREAA